MIEYQRDIPADSSDDVADAEEVHVRAQLSAMATADDDPDTHAEDVDIVRIRLDDGGLRIRGFLDAAPTAPYLEADHNHLTGVDLDLLAQFPGAMGLEDGEQRG